MTDYAPPPGIEIGSSRGPHQATVMATQVGDEPAIEIQLLAPWSGSLLLPQDLAWKVADAINEVLGRRNEALEAAVVAAEEAMLYLEGISMLNYIGKGTKAGMVWGEVIRRREKQHE